MRNKISDVTVYKVTKPKIVKKRDIRGYNVAIMRIYKIIVKYKKHKKHKDEKNTNMEVMNNENV